jgi:3-oxoacyl-[acyl-carrier protein] reductase
MSELLDLKERIALVTGAGQGVGRQVALHLAAHNAGGIVVNDYYMDRASAVAAEIEALGVRSLPIQADVGDLAAMRRMLASAEEKFGGIDILVNNAGNAGSAMALTDSQPFWETEPDEWQHWFRTNLYGVLNASRAVLEGMRQRSYGRIVTVISDAGRVGEARYVVYSAAKAGAAGFTRALARAVGRDGVNVNCVSLSAVRTPALNRLLGNPERVSKMLARYPLGRLGEPEDAANMILFLASDAASWITGQTIPVNGGFSFAV